MTGKSLVRKMLRNDALRRRYLNPAWTPGLARTVLDSVASLIAQSEEPGVWRPDLEAERASSLGQYVAEAFDFVGFEAEFDSLIAALVRSGLLIDDGGGLALPIVTNGSLGAKAEAARRNGSAGGRPRAGETPEQAAERRRAAQLDVARRQTNMPLPIRGGLFSETHGETQTETHEITDIKPTVGFPVGLSSVSAPGFGTESAAAVERDSKAYQPTTAADSSFETRAQNPRGNPRPNPPGNPPGFRKTHGTDHAGVSVSPEPVISVEATGLAKHAALGRGWSTRQVQEAPEVMQGYLDAGYTAAQIRAVVEETASTKISSARYFGAVLDRTHGNELRARQAIQAPRPRLTLHPDVEEIPEWRNASGDTPIWIGKVLQAMDEPASAARRTRLDVLRSTQLQAFDLVAKRRPEIWEMLGRDPPASAAERAAPTQKAASG